MIACICVCCSTNEAHLLRCVHGPLLALALQGLVQQGAEALLLQAVGVDGVRVVGEERVLLSLRLHGLPRLLSVPQLLFLPTIDKLFF